MTGVVAQQAALIAPSSRQDVVSELLDDYTYENPYDSEDMSPKLALAPAFKELPAPPLRTDSLRDPKAEAIQRMNTKFQLREDDASSISSHGSRNVSLDQTPRTRITSRSLSRSGTPPSLRLFVSNGATAHIPPTPMVYPPVKPIPSSIDPNSKELPPPPPERSIKRKEVQDQTRGHQPSKSELERNDSFHSQSEGRHSKGDPSETAGAAPPVERKAVPGAGVKKFVNLFELNHGPRGGKPAPTSAPREASSNQEMGTIHSSNAAPSKIPVRKETATSNQLPPTPPEEKSVPSPPSRAFVGAGLPTNPRSKQPMSPLHARGKSSTGFNILKAQRPAPPIPTMRKEVTTPEMTPSPTLKPEVRIDAEISPMKPLPPPTEHRRPFSYEERSKQQGSPKQVEPLQEVEQQREEEPEQLAPPTVAPPAPTPPAQPSFPLRTTSLDPPEPSPSIRPSTAPAPQSAFSAPHASLPAHTFPATVAEESAPSPNPPDAPFIPLTQRAIPLSVTLIPQITASQLACYTRHATSIWSNNVFQPMGCMLCHANHKDRKWMCTWCQLRLCRGCSDALRGVPGRELGRLLDARREEKEEQREREARGQGDAAEENPTVLVEHVDLVEIADVYAGEETSGEETETETERGRSMVRVDSRERDE